MSMYKILILNGNVDERSLLYDVLREFDEEFELYEAKEKEDTLRIIHSKNIQIVITDRHTNLYEIYENYPYLEIIMIGNEQPIFADNIRCVKEPLQKDDLKQMLIEAIHHIIKREEEGSVWEVEHAGIRAAEKRVSLERDDTWVKEIETAISLKNGEVLKFKLEQALRTYRTIEEQYPFYVRSMYMMILQLLVKIVPSKMSDLEKMIEYIFKTEQSIKIENLLLTYAELVVDEFENEAKSSNRVIYQVKQYINLHYHEDLKLSHLAEQVYLSTNYLSNIFTKYTGRSLNKYIKEVRLSKAQELLLSTNMKIADIGRSVGYDNTSYFIKKFQEQYGVTPEKYRMKPIDQEETWN